MTARAQKAFLSVFWIYKFDLLIFLLVFSALERACSLLLGASVPELVRVRASTHGAPNRTAALLDVRGPGPDLTWQRTLAVVVCAALAGVFKRRKYEIELN